MTQCPTHFSISRNVRIIRPDYTSGLYVRIIRPKIAQTLVQPIAQTLVQPIAQTLVQKGFSTGPLKNHQ